MRLCTLRLEGGATCAARVEGDRFIELAFSDVGELLGSAAGVTAAATATNEVREWGLSEVSLDAPSPRPGKVICLGLNYRHHILEMGMELPDFPTLFAKFTEALIGPNDEIVLPDGVNVDWEVELAVVVGRPIRHATPEQAMAALGGYTVGNDISVRDWQWRTSQWLQGKTFESTTPTGPMLVTPDEVDLGEAVVRCWVNWQLMQEAPVADMVFGVADTLAYISRFITLKPGDLVFTGTPGGVGAARDPQVFLQPGDEVVTAITGLGELRNRCVAEPLPRPADLDVVAGATS
jgi:acylpyruvate hydrolase